MSSLGLYVSTHALLIATTDTCQKMFKLLLNLFPNSDPNRSDKLCTRTSGAGVRTFREYDVLSSRNQIILPSVWEKVVRPGSTVKVHYRDTPLSTEDEHVIVEAYDERVNDGG
jgi:hypothetical protein